MFTLYHLIIISCQCIDYDTTGSTERVCGYKYSETKSHGRLVPGDEMLTTKSCRWQIFLPPHFRARLYLRSWGDGSKAYSGQGDARLWVSYCNTYPSGYMKQAWTQPHTKINVPTFSLKMVLDFF